MKCALVVELFPSHGFLIPPVSRLLAGAGYEVSFAIHDVLTSEVPAGTSAQRVRLLHSNGDAVSLLSLWRLARFIRTRQFDLVFFLTVRTRGVATLVRLLPKSLLLAGLHHNPDKLWRSGSQKRLAKRGVRCLVLSRRAWMHVRERAPWASVEYIYPGALDPRLAAPPPHPLRLVVPGQLDLGKRDYRQLVEAVAADPRAYEEMQFLLLGDGSACDGEQIRRWIRDAGVGARFQMWPAHIPADEYDRQMAQCHAILPLIHPVCESAERFQSVKISGSIILAHQYGLPLVLEEGFRKTDGEYDSQALFYTSGSLAPCLRQLAGKLPSPVVQRAVMARDPRFDAAAQQERFNRFLDA